MTIQLMNGDCLTMSLTLDQNGKLLTETIGGITMPAELSFQAVNEFVHATNTHFEELQALCLGLASELEKAKQAPDCLKCANRGAVRGLTQETFCDSCIYQSRSWRKNYFKPV